FFDSDSSRNLGLGRARARIATPARPAPNCLQNPNRIVFNCVATIALVFCVFGAYPFTRQFSALDIMSQAHGLGSCVRCPVVIRLGAWRLGSLDLPLDILAGAGPHLFFCVPLTSLSDSRSHRAARNLACQRLPGSSRPVPGHLARLWFAPTLLWFSSSSHVLLGLCWMGMFASLLLVLN